jgi:hypothetical protein
VRTGIFLTLLCGALLHAAEPPLRPVTVCEVLQNLSAYDGQVVAVVGRLSFRRTGRWLGEQKCTQKLVMGGQEWPNAFWVAYDPQNAPKPPAVLAVDAPLLAEKLREVKQGSSLTKLPFGSSDYDSWAVIYCRVETRKDLILLTESGARKNGFGYGESSPARLVCHGDAVVVLLSE